MTILRWIVGISATLMATGALAAFAIAVIFDAPLWQRWGRRFRHAAWMALLLWFNVEVWGRVIGTLIGW